MYVNVVKYFVDFTCKHIKLVKCKFVTTVNIDCHKSINMPNVIF